MTILIFSAALTLILFLFFVAVVYYERRLVRRNCEARQLLNQIRLLEDELNHSETERIRAWAYVQELQNRVGKQAVIVIRTFPAEAQFSLN